MDESKKQAAARMALAGSIIMIMVELLKIANELPKKDLPRYLPELKSCRAIVLKMYSKDIFEIGKKLYLDMPLWQTMPDGVASPDRIISKHILRGLLRTQLQDVGYEFSFNRGDWIGL